MSRRLIKPLPPSRGIQTPLSLAVTEWRLYQVTMQLPAPSNDRRFMCELLSRADPIALRQLAQFGDAASQEESWKVIARSGDSLDLSGLVMLTGPAPISWMEEAYWLYTPEQVKESVVYNALSRLDSPAVTNWIENGKYADDRNSVVSRVLSRILDPREVGMEQVLISCVDVIETGDGIIIEQLIDEPSLTYIASIYEVDTDLPRKLMEILTLERDNRSDDPTHFYNTRWVATYAPWLILRSGEQLQESFFEYYEPYRIELLYGTSKDKERLLSRVDPTRLALSSYFTVLPDVLDIVPGNITDTSLWN